MGHIALCPDCQLAGVMPHRNTDPLQVRLTSHNKEPKEPFVCSCSTVSLCWGGIPQSQGWQVQDSSTP